VSGVFIFFFFLSSSWKSHTGNEVRQSQLCVVIVPNAVSPLDPPSNSVQGQRAGCEIPFAVTQSASAAITLDDNRCTGPTARAVELFRPGDR